MGKGTRASKLANTFCKILAGFWVARFAGNIPALYVEASVMNVEMLAHITKLAVTIFMKLADNSTFTFHFQLFF